MLPSLAVRADRSIPPVSGGTLEANDDTIVAADPVRDVIWVVRRDEGTLSESRIDLPAGSEPGRVLFADDDALVVLRGTGSVARVDLASATITAQSDVCEAPRGIDARREGFVVACVEGTLVFLDDALRVTGRREVVPDLRDVVIEYDEAGVETTWVSTFRAAEILELRGDLTTTHELEAIDDHLPRVAWRMRRHETGGGVDVLHEQMSRADFAGAPLAYYGSALTLPPNRIVRSALTYIRPDGFQDVTTVPGVPLVVDFVRRGGLVSYAAAYVRSREEDAPPGVFQSTGLSSRNVQSYLDAPIQSVAMSGEQIVSFSARNGVLLVEHGSLTLAPPVFDTGHDLFHATTPAEVTCASCHPGGRDDAYVWTFSGLERRTQPLTGGILASAPYHWEGDLAGLDEVVFGTFDTRMDGPDVTPSQVSALGAWLDTLPALRIPPSDFDAVARGRALYGEYGCAGCHDVSADPESTVLQIVQAPPLFGVGVRGPYFSDGCADSLERAMGFGACVDGHPVFWDEDLSDMVAYLEQL